MAQSFTTPPGTASFVHIIEPKAIAEGPAKYSLNVIFPPSSQKSPAYKKMQAAVQQLLDDKFGSKMKDPKFRAGLASPFKDAATKTEWNGYQEGWTFISPRSKYQPQLLRKDGEDIFEVTDLEELFAGCVVKASVSFYAYDESGNRGCGVSLNSVMIINSDMPRLDNRRAGAQEFRATDDGDDDLSDFGIRAPI